MYCSKCGTEIVDGKCPNCNSVNNLKNFANSAYVFVGTIATMLILRLATQETRRIQVPDSWREYETEYFVPGNIQGIMIVLLLGSLFVLYRLCNDGKCSKTKTELMMLAEIILGLIIPFVRFTLG